MNINQIIWRFEVAVRTHATAQQLNRPTKTTAARVREAKKELQEALKPAPVDQENIGRITQRNKDFLIKSILEPLHIRILGKLHAYKEASWEDLETSEPDWPEQWAKAQAQADRLNEIIEEVRRA